MEGAGMRKEPKKGEKARKRALKDLKVPKGSSAKLKGGTGRIEFKT
jgi:uncharacterized Zn ribbon protein